MPGCNGFCGALVATVLAVAGCKPVAFASHETNLMREPPPILGGDASAFWNDRTTGAYGELTVGSGMYRRDDAVCRTARITSIDGATHRAEDRTVLYCARAGGPFKIDPNLSCRATQTGPDVTCRISNGDDVTLPPV